MTPTARQALPAILAVGLLLGACGTTTSGGAAAPSTSSPSTPAATASTEASEPSATTSGAPAAEARDGYVAYADYSADPAAFSAGPVVLFFHADWCPKCRETDSNLTADPASLPDGVTVVKLDFDSETELRQKYGVTVQHTFVQIDADGEKLGAWTGTYTGGEIASKVA
jgi:thiol-disulfide isomerase/thioredoxin